MGMNHRKGFTLIELLVVVFSIAFLFFILILVLSAKVEGFLAIFIRTYERFWGS